MKRKILAILCAAVMVIIPMAVWGTESTEIQNRLAAGEVCGIIADHECDHCREGAASALTLGSTCPDCGSGTLRNVCSGTRKLNRGSSYFYVECYVSGHPSGCQTVQTRYYTDVTCSNPNCNYRGSGADWHIESYFHSMDSGTYDNHYCSLPVDLRSASFSEPIVINQQQQVDNDMPWDPVAAGDVCAAHIAYQCPICPKE